MAVLLKINPEEQRAEARGTSGQHNLTRKFVPDVNDPMRPKVSCHISAAEGLKDFKPMTP